MRLSIPIALIALAACGSADDANGGHITLPRVYPPVRANTPTDLIADPQYKPVASTSSALIAGLPQALGGPVNLAIAVQERLYTPGPTSILRIVHELDDRTAQLETDPSKHSCLTSTPVSKTLALPDGATFDLKLQCFSQFQGGWLAFGFDAAQQPDAGTSEPKSAGDFYLLQGQDGGMGGAYQIEATTGNVEAWISVADSRSPNNSQAIMHMLTDKTAGTLELALAGSGIGLCSAHLKTGDNYLFISAKTNGAPPPGTPMEPGSQYCDSVRTGCFDTSALEMELAENNLGCKPIATPSFQIALDLDASTDPGANVDPATIYEYFNKAPDGLPTF